MRTWRVIYLGFLATVGAGLAFLVWAKLKARYAGRSTNEKLVGRQPGFVGNLLDHVGGVFGLRNKPETVPPMVYGYGAVGVPQYGEEYYQSVPLDANVPSFLEGATGGVRDDEQPGRAPPERLGPPALAACGVHSAKYHPCDTSVTARAYAAKNSSN